MADPIPQVGRILKPETAEAISRPDWRGKGDGGQTSFGELLGKALDDLNRVAVRGDQLAEAFAAGADVEIHDVIIAMQEAQIAFELATQVRNRMVDAYQEIMRMQV